jgi:hypothetical protein
VWVTAPGVRIPLSPIRKMPQRHRGHREIFLNNTLCVFSDSVVSFFGKLSERLKEHAWKACVCASIPGVRIPHFPKLNIKKEIENKFEFLS